MRIVSTWFGWRRSRSHASREAERSVRDLWVARTMLGKSLQKLVKLEKRIRSLIEQQKRIGEILSEDAVAHRRDLERAQREMERSEKALELLRRENEVLNEVVVPALTSGCKSIQERWEADIAASGSRKAMAVPRGNDEEYQ